MGNENGYACLSWEAVIRTFLNEKRNAEENKYLKPILKSVTAEFSKAKWFDSEEIEALFDNRKNRKNEEQSLLESQRQLYAQAKSLPTQPEGLSWQEIDDAYVSKVSELERKYAPPVWITYAALNSESVSFATHVAKLTHSKIDSPSLIDEIAGSRSDMLTTSSLAEIVIDGAVAGNQYAPIFQFLELECEGLKLTAELSKGDSVALEPFAKDKDQLAEWNQAFKKATVAGKLSTHALLKQVYFPIAGSGSEKYTLSQYHLLTHMTSSSMAQAVFNRLFNDEQSQVKKQYAKGKYSPTARVAYPRRAKISVTASNHSNASQLNGKRGGKLHLLSSQAPTWTRQLSPPINMKSWFDYGISNYSVKENIDYLREFLLRFERLEMSTRSPERRKWINRWGSSIVDDVLFQAATIQTLPAGWSDNPKIKLKEEQQFFLDPYRVDEAFQAKCQSTDWQKVVCKDFARWLNRQLSGTDKKFTPQDEHTKLWMSLMEVELREWSEYFNVAPIETIQSSAEEIR